MFWNKQKPKRTIYYVPSINRFAQLRERTPDGLECGDFCEFYGDAQTATRTQVLSDAFFAGATKVGAIDQCGFARWDDIGWRVLPENDPGAKEAAEEIARAEAEEAAYASKSAQEAEAKEAAVAKMAGGG